MFFLNNGLIANSNDLTWYWRSHLEPYSTFTRTEVFGGTIDFSHSLDYFDLTSDTAEKLRKIGEPYDFFDKTIPIALNEFTVNIFEGFNDDDGIGSILRNFTNYERERNCYAVYASFFYINNSVFCALTICFIDKDTATELDTAILEIGQDEGSYISPITISEEATQYFSFDTIKALGEYLANVWFGIQYEMNNRPEEIRIIEQRGSVSPNDNTYDRNRIVLVKRIIPVDENGNIIKYGKTDSGREYKMPVWGVRGHPRTLPDGRVIQVKPYPKGKERNNPEYYNSKEYQFVEDKIDDDSKK
ncbi:MAG: hypothetical protein IJL32_04690 [Oscillospiraceae bacterium]|nr:hypothetical protein [Oscillospiraceae bacterium]